MIYGYYCGTFRGLSYWWPGSGKALSIFKFKNETKAQETINFWVENYNVNKEWLIIQEFNEKLSNQIFLQAPPIEGKC